MVKRKSVSLLFCHTTYHEETEYQEIGVETMASAFTDHLAVIQRLSIEVPIVRRSRGFLTVRHSKRNYTSSGRSGYTRGGSTQICHVVGKVCQKIFVRTVFRKGPNAGRTW